jgi:hypothetical protein
MDNHRLFPDVCAGPENGFVGNKNCFIAQAATTHGDENPRCFSRLTQPPPPAYRQASIKKIQPPVKIKRLMAATLAHCGDHDQRRTRG